MRERMKRILFFTVMFVASVAWSQSKDTLNYAGGSRITTAYSPMYIGSKGIWKFVNIGIDTASSTQTVTFVVGAASDTNNSVKRNQLRLANFKGFNGYGTSRDTLWMKVDNGSVLTTVIVFPIAPIQTR